MIKKYLETEFKNNEELFNICKEIYEEKYFLEDFDLSDISDITFYVYELNNKVIGFGAYQNLDFLFHLCYLTFKKEYELSIYEEELINHILSEIKVINDKNINVSVYLNSVKDKKFYEKLNFKLYKDFKKQTPFMFENMEGKDLTRFVMELK